MRVLLLLSLFVAVVSAYKVAIFAPDIANSQVMFNKRVAEILAAGGHDVTLVLTQTFTGRDNSDVKISNNVKIHNVNASIGMTRQEADKQQSEIIFEDLPAMSTKMRTHFTRFMGMLTETCRNTLRNKEFLSWLIDQKFDVAFVHQYHACPIGLVHYAKIPSWIWLNSGQLMDFVSDNIGVPLIPSYVPPMILPSTDEMDFVSRAKSFIFHAMCKMFWPKMIANVETKMFREEIDPNFPDLIGLARQCPLVMANSNEFYDLPRPLLAKVIYIGGVGSQKKDAKPLPQVIVPISYETHFQNFEKIVNKGKGLVVVSFGSVAPAHLIPDHWKAALVGAFKRLPDYQFVMRYEGKDLQDKIPPNAHLFKWLPQTDLLAHKNTRGFLTHAGYNSLQETIHAGKPMVTIALFGDQPKNAQIAKKHGFAINLSKGNISEDSIYDALKEIIDNQSYGAKAARLSVMVAKRPIAPETLLLRWTEFVAEFQTLENMVPAGQKLNFFQYHSLDVIGLISFIVLTVLFIVFKLLSCVVRCIFCRKGNKAKVE